MKMKVFTVAHLPHELAQAWLQHLRDFDTQHPGCHFEVMADAPNLTLAEMTKLVQIDPALSFEQIIRLPRRWAAGDEE